jgi:FkbM family methyltransferase
MESPRHTLVAFPSCSAEKLEASLLQIFSESLAHVMEREETALTHLLADRAGQCVIFGAGNMGRRAVRCLRSVGVYPLAISDNNPSLWGLSVEGISVLPPEIAAEQFGADSHFFIAIRNESHWYKETHRQLHALGCDFISSSEPIASQFPNVFPPFLPYDQHYKVYMQADAVMRAAELWADDQSRAEYLAQVRLRALGDPSDLVRPAAEESYFLAGVFELDPGEVLLDCGAYDGDTIRSVIDLDREFKRIEAVEADSHSFARLAAYVATIQPAVRNKIRLHHCAIGSARGAVRFQDTGGVDSRISDQGQILVDMVPIDVMFASKRVSMIKMDIEGGEYDALLGARQVIQRDRPILAICVYHSQEDLWRLPLLMRELCPDHRMYLKAYRGDGIQTVAYAVPPGRVLGSQPPR